MPFSPRVFGEIRFPSKKVVPTYSNLSNLEDLKDMHSVLDLERFALGREASQFSHAENPSLQGSPSSMKDASVHWTNNLQVWLSLFLRVPFRGPLKRRHLDTNSAARARRLQLLLRR